MRAFRSTMLTVAVIAAVSSCGPAAVGNGASTGAAKTSAPGESRAPDPATGPTITTSPGVTASASPASTKYDPLAATPDEKYLTWSKLARDYGSPGGMTRNEAPQVAANFCDNDIKAMQFYLSTGTIIETQKQVVADAVALADAYCPQQRVIIEGAMSALGFLGDLPRGS